MDKYKQYIDIQWWNGVTKRDIENWIRNFGSSEKLAKIILDNVIFYNSQQMKAYARYLINSLNEQVYKQTMRENKYEYINDVVLNEKWNTYIAETRIIPASLPSDPTSSAHNVVKHWRSTLGQGSDYFSVISNMEKDYLAGIHRFILVDDFSGSGKQMMKVLKHQIDFMGKKVEVGRLPESYPDVEITFAVYVIHQQAKVNLNKYYPKVGLLYVDMIDDNLNYFNENYFIYKSYSEEEKHELVQEMEKLSENIMNDNEKFRELSSYVLNIPIVFEHGCPNNTLLLLFAHTDNWQQLFKRGNEI